ncbi:hypothetical protein LTR27_007619 [Elasticomyces elasticus]|nr:hypothetical protein LTR27_007619 [Elasticomyces elasticus]
MPPIPGLVHWHSLLTRHLSHIKAALQRAATTLDALSLQPTPTKLEPLLARINPKQPTHPLARIRQNQSRWYSSAARQLSESGSSSTRHFSSSGAGKAGRVQRSSFPKSRVGGYVAQSSGRAPFAHTLRPNLTGGTLSRTSGGYTLGSATGKRAFSHVPAAQAQVVQNVSQAIRAFVVGGQKAQFDGVGQRGEKRFKAVSALQDETGRKLRSLPKQTPGSWVEFRVNPSVTAIADLGSVAGAGAALSTESCAVNLNTSGLLDVLSVDFSRALKDLAAVMNDLRSLSALGNLPITYEGQSLRVHFPGCDGETVERLCEELGITRGSVRQDEGFDAFAGTEIALLFPFAPSKEGSRYSGESLYDDLAVGKKYPIDVRSMFTPSEEHLAYSTQSAVSDDEYEDLDGEVLENPWLSDPEGYESVRSGSGSGGNSGYGSEKAGSPLEYQGFEGIYRFIEELDGVRK